MAQVPPSYRAQVYERYGATDQVLQLRELPTPVLAPTQVRVQVLRAALNPVDYLLTEGLGAVMLPVQPTADQPLGLGFDLAGVVVEVGPSVDHTKLKVGDEVYAMTPFSAFGTIAEYVSVDQEYVALKPTSIDFDQAAGLPLAALTSYQSLFELAKLQGAGQRVLILGGSSSTGIFAVQFAKAVGAHVITTTSAKNAELVKSLGADVVIDYHTQKWADVVENHSIDVLYDCGMEPAAWNTEAQSVLKKQTGQFVTLQPVPEPIESVIGATRHQQVVHPSARDLEAIAKLVDKGAVKVVVDSVVTLESVLDGVALVKSRRAVGKVIVRVAA